MIKIKFDLDLDDLLTEDFDYFSENNELRLKDDSELKDTIKEKINDAVVNCIQNSFKHSFNYEVQQLVKDLVADNKDLIINNVVKEVSKKIINTKKMNDFKKTLMEDEKED